MPTRSAANPVDRAQFLDDAAQILSSALGTVMAPNGGHAIANNRMGIFVPAMNVGVVATAGELRVHLHSRQAAHRRLYTAIVAAIASGALAPPGALAVATRPGPRAPGLIYLEHAWLPRDLDALDLGSVRAMANWLLLIRPRF